MKLEGKLEVEVKNKETSELFNRCHFEGGKTYFFWSCPKCNFNYVRKEYHGFCKKENGEHIHFFCCCGYEWGGIARSDADFKGNLSEFLFYK